MARCDFCGRHATDIIRIGGAWHGSCCGCADRTEHTDRHLLTRSTRRLLRG